MVAIARGLRAAAVLVKQDERGTGWWGPAARSEARGGRVDYERRAGEPARAWH